MPDERYDSISAERLVDLLLGDFGLPVLAASEVINKVNSDLRRARFVFEGQVYQVSREGDGYYIHHDEGDTRARDAQQLHAEVGRHTQMSQAITNHLSRLDAECRRFHDEVEDIEARYHDQMGDQA